MGSKGETDFTPGGKCSAQEQYPAQNPVITLQILHQTDV